METLARRTDAGTPRGVTRLPGVRDREGADARGRGGAQRTGARSSTRPPDHSAAALRLGVLASGSRRPPLRREARQRLPDVPLAQALERPVAQLADALARHAQHPPDLLEGVLPAAVEPEVEPQ